MLNWLVYAGILCYMELVFHLGCYGLTGYNPIFPIGIIALVSALQALVTGLVPEKCRRLTFWILTILEVLVYFTQLVYYKIFRQPLQLGAALVTGQDALTDYWRQALNGILHALPLMLFMVLPLILLSVVKIKGSRWQPLPVQGMQHLGLWLGALGSLIYCVCSIFVGSQLDAEYSENYREFYAPERVLEEMGVLTLVQRDCWYEIENLISGNSAIRTPTHEIINAAGTGNSESEDTQTEDAQTEGSESSESQIAENTQAQEPDTSPNVLDLDMDRLAELSAGSREMTWLADYIAGLTPTKRNKYTGMFEGYNLIYLTAEGFSTYAVREDLTPTLYKMLHSSFVFNNYYVPLWQTSTSDGEYVNCTGLIPDGQHSMRKSADNRMIYNLPYFFSKENVYCRAYHNNSLSYYSRHLTHPNLGYDFKAARLGDLTEEEWGSKIFPMEHPDAWPQSDYEMMVGTLPEYINDERFHVYYMTVSGHMEYTFSDNRMSSWHKEEVAGLDLPNNDKAYIACNMELDKAMEYLLKELEKAGKLENTVICMSADHYPYGLTDEEYEQLAGRDLSNDMDMYRNSLFLYNAGMTEPVYIDKACCSVDILPTLLNLFGFDFDSRMYAGRDILSDAEGLVIFNDRSFVSDTVAYNRKKRTAAWKKALSAEEQEDYLKAQEQEVKNRYQASAYILRNDYYDILKQCER